MLSPGMESSVVCVGGMSGDTKPGEVLDSVGLLFRIVVMGFSIEPVV